MKSILSERNIVVVLFVLVLITFSLAQEDSKKMEKMYTGTNIYNTPRMAVTTLGKATTVAITQPIKFQKKIK
jgi:hypothetical protein